jgi:hypothetical protein
MQTVLDTADPRYFPAIAAIRRRLGDVNFRLLHRVFRNEVMTQEQFELYMKEDRITGYPALALYKYIYPDAVVIVEEETY